MSKPPPTPNDPVPPNCWIPRNADGMEILWFPIIEFGEPRRALGLSRDGQWAWGAIQEGSSEVFPVAEPSVVGLLPLLELSLPMIRAEARRVAPKGAMRPAEVVEALPVEQILVAALSTRSDYWVSLAIDWLDHQSPSDELVTAVDAAATDRRLGQVVRHALLRWRRSGNAGR